MRRSSRPRKSTELSDSIRRRLNLYALGTAAAGVAAMAMAPAAEAKIVYTPAHLPLVGTIVDLNHDGTGDITFLSAVDATTSVGMRSVQAKSANSLGINEVVATAAQDHAVALPAGERIGPADTSERGASSMEMCITAILHTQLGSANGLTEARDLRIVTLE
jgi:hypothetical protein